ncbi:hypothetical protein MIND_01103200 [Mycena indigotica]|uniref:Nascent polypeptide-associated complex subunit alpha-like UBA domain-containing protein n=1 Tax=Mycena indigotica TaxID=2126181 RepID=A0A8H6SD11_9AGAR|nr:uncharacterized protein MIND_01103200 [Mycena indigotica]KAF7295630.1 hypothetical protein MIND_01103200 [Mycena indigotica]
MSRSTANGRPEPEVIVNFGDGFAYSKQAMGEAFRAGGLLDRPPAVLHAHPPLTKAQRELIKREDVDVIVSEFEIPKAQAERVLVEHKGNLQDALRALVGL